MKAKTSITLTRDLLERIDAHKSEFHSRSEFLEQAARQLLAKLAKKEADRRDLEIINRRADSLNAEAEDALAYQEPV
jgi:metal-responsive CopG/Arc/MetJ family transcriptional regulator